MDMDHEQSSPSNLIKWPFFASAVFILGFVLYFALNRSPDEPLDQWQLANINQAGWHTPKEKAAVLQCVWAKMPA